MRNVIWRVNEPWLHGANRAPGTIFNGHTASNLSFSQLAAARANLLGEEFAARKFGANLGPKPL